MKTTIVCGLLGAGKTTFIQQFVKGAEGKIVVLVNDFGKAGIDGEIFSADGIESIELPSGCVCCTLKFDLITTIEKVLKNFAPEHFLIEPSGVASPSGILETLEMLRISPVTVIGIVDATEFLELHEAGMYGRFFEDQIVNSDIVLVNKTDLAGDETVRETVARIEDLNPGAVIFRTVRAEMREPYLSVYVHTKHRTSQKAGDHLHFETVSVKLSGPVEFQRLMKMFDELASGAYGRVARAKALAQTDRGPFRFDLSFGKVEEVIFGKPVEESRLVVIGEHLDKDAILSAVAHSS